MGDRIPVVFTPDENFIIQTSVAIISMLRSKKSKTKYYFYLVVSSSIDRIRLHYFDDVKVLYSDFEYEIVYIDSHQFDNLLITTKHLSTSAYYRLMLPIILPNEDRVMYHDGDILVMEDLTEMYNADMGQNYVAGIPSINAIQESEWKHTHISNWGFKTMDGYIFSGDLVLNLKLMREDGICGMFEQQMVLGMPSEDQDVLNYCCGKKIYHLPLKYCMLSRWINNNSLFEFNNKLYSEAEIVEAQKNPVIIHYAGAVAKPWVNTRAVFGKVWWSIVGELLDESDYESILKVSEEKTVERDFRTLYGRINKLADKYDGIVIYGAGKAGRALLKLLKTKNLYVKGFVDKAEKISGNNIDGVTVYSKKFIPDLSKDSFFIISVQNEFERIKRDLLCAGLNPEQIFVYYYKDKLYLDSVDLAYKAFEFEDCGVNPS